MKKNNYLTPESELLFVRFEENILSGYGNDGQPGGSTPYAPGDETDVD